MACVDSLTATFSRRAREKGRVRYRAFRRIDGDAFSWKEISTCLFFYWALGSRGRFSFFNLLCLRVRWFTACGLSVFTSASLLLLNASTHEHTRLFLLWRRGLRWPSPDCFGEGTEGDVVLLLRGWPAVTWHQSERQHLLAQQTSAVSLLGMKACQVQFTVGLSSRLSCEKCSFV